MQFAEENPSECLVISERCLNIPRAAQIQRIRMVLPAKTEVKKRKQAKWETGQIVEGRTVRIRVDQDLCMASQSCISLAPKVFRIDWSKRKSNFEGAPIEVKDKKAADNETIFLAAQSRPWQAIILEDAITGERPYSVNGLRSRLVTSQQYEYSKGVTS